MFLKKERVNNSKTCDIIWDIMAMQGFSIVGGRFQHFGGSVCLRAVPFESMGGGE